MHMQLIYSLSLLKLFVMKKKKAISITQSLLGRENDYKIDYLNGLLFLIRQQVLSDEFIEKIFINPKVIYYQIGNYTFFKTLEMCWKPTKEIITLYECTNNVQTAIFFYALFQATSLEDIVWILIRCVDLNINFNELHHKVKTRLQRKYR